MILILHNKKQIKLHNKNIQLSSSLRMITGIYVYLTNKVTEQSVRLFDSTVSNMVISGRLDHTLEQ